MKRLAIFGFSTFFVLIVLAAIAVALVPRFVDVNAYKTQASEKIKEATGFDVEFGGNVSLGLFPMPHASLADVYVKNPAGFSGGDLARFESMDVQVALAPLMSKRVEVQTVRLVKPEVFLEADKQGKTNWSVQTIKSAEGEGGTASDEAAAPEISLNGIEISDGMVSYKNGVAAPIVIKDINLDVDAKSLQGPFDIEGSLAGFEQRLKFKTAVKSFKDLSEPLSVTVSGSVSPANVAFSYAGIIDAEKQAAQGQADVKFEGGQLKGMLNATAKEVSFTDMNLAAQGHTVKGAMSATLDPLAFKGKVNADGTALTFSGTYKDVLDIAVKADTVDFDRILGAKSSGEGLNQPLGLPPGSKSAKTSKPLGVVFDAQIAKAIYQGQTISNIKANGAMKGDSLGLKSLSVGTVAGASVNASGSVANIKSLSGIDGNVSGTISDIAAFAAFTKMDASSVPAYIKSLGFDVTAKGDLKGVLNMSATAKALKGAFTAKGAVKNATSKPSFEDMSVTVQHPNFSNLLKVVAPDAPRYDSFAAPLKLDATVAMAGKVVRLNGIKANLGKTAVNGSLAVNSGASKPSLSGALTFGDLTLKSSGAAPAGGSSAKSGGTSGKAKWSGATMNSSWLNAMNADLDIKAKSLLYQSWDIKNPSIKFVMKNGTLDIQDLKAGLYGGTLTLASVLKPLNANGTGMNISTNAQFNNVDLEKLAGSFIGTKVIKATGKASLSAQVSGQGVSQAALVSSLSGNGDLSGSAIVLEGFDVAKFAQSMSIDTKPGDSVLGLWKTSTKGGTTTFDTLKGQYSIARGVITLEQLALDGATAAIQSSGTVNLPKWSLDTKHSITAKGSELPPFTVDIAGPLDNPGQTFAQGAIQNYLQQKLKRKLDKVLGDKLNLGGGDAPIEQQLFDKFIGGKLNDKLGIETPTPAANDNTAPAQSETPAAAPVKKEEPKKVQPADPVDQILKEVVPNEAVQDLLKGLF